MSAKELLVLLDALRHDVIRPSIDDFYFLSRATLVKDEAHFDKFDRAFGEYFHGVQTALGITKEIPVEWFRQLLERDLTPEEHAKLEKLGCDKLMEEFRKRLEEQKARHEGGNKWIGTAALRPSATAAASARHPHRRPVEGRQAARSRSGKRAPIATTTTSVELGTRNIKVALRRLRHFARQGAELELDLHDTIESTAKNAGWLDIKMVPERHNNVKVLMLLDVGGTMDEHIKRVEELFSAAKSEFKHLEFYYFHNCVYESVWNNNRRRFAEKFATWDVLRKYNPD